GKTEVLDGHVPAEAVILEVVISGTHRGGWRGLPATGRSVEFQLCGIFTFGSEGKIAAERIYYDRATVLRQLGVFREPTTLGSRILTPILHPITIVRALLRRPG